MLDWLSDLVYLVALATYAAAIAAAIYFFCYKTLRPNIICPVCKKNKLKVSLRRMALECDKCGGVIMEIEQ